MRRLCRTSGCQKPATRKGMCSAHYMVAYRAAKAKREKATAKENAICAAAGCKRKAESGRLGLCRPCYQKRWSEDRRLGAVERPKAEALKDFWAIVQRFALPIEVAAHDAELRLTEGVVAELVAKGKRRGIDFAVNRYWYDRMVDELLEDGLVEPVPWERARFISPKEGPEPPPYKPELDDLPDPAPSKLDEVPA